MGAIFDQFTKNLSIKLYSYRHINTMSSLTIEYTTTYSITQNCTRKFGPRGATLLLAFTIAAVCNFGANSAYASECATDGSGAGGTAVASGGSCDISSVTTNTPYDPTANDNHVGTTVVNGGDTVTLTGPGSSIAAGDPGSNPNTTLGALQQAGQLQGSPPDLSTSFRLNLPPQTQGVLYPDPITNGNVTVQTYNSALFTVTAQSTVGASQGHNVVGNQYINAQLATVDGNTGGGGTLNVEPPRVCRRLIVSNYAATGMAPITA